MLVQYASIEMSWAGRRPLAPDPASGDVVQIFSHGIMYVSQADLDFQHYFVMPGLLFAGLGIIVTLVARAMGEPIRAPRNSRLERVGTAAEIAFIGFLPIWLFANPYLALARTIPDPRWLLLADIGTALIGLGWWTVMQHGAILKGGRRERTLRT